MEKLSKEMTERVLFFYLLRCVAALAVITIHVIGPYRHGLGTIPIEQWLVVIGINSASRWAVPVFILITGALMLSDQRAFNPRYYVQRRCSRVVVPFLFWSIFYALLSGWTTQGNSIEHTLSAIRQLGSQATYYHLGFFYYFIPLYLVVPLFHWMRQHFDDSWLYGFVVLWLFSSVLFLFRVDGFWSHPLWLYVGYLPLGYLLFKKVPLTGRTVTWFVLLGLAALAVTFGMVAFNSLESGKYSVGRWLSYKTLNVILVAAMVFILCRFISERLPLKTHKAIHFVGQYCFGIYLLPPLFLWPMREMGWFSAHPVLAIPTWVLLSGLGALVMSYWLSLSAKTRWLVP